MADVKKTIEILFIGNDQVSSLTDSIVDDLGGLNNAVADATQPFADMAGAILKADVALATLAAGGLAYAFVQAKNLESSTIDLAKVMGGFGPEVDSAKTAAIELSNAYGQSAVSILDSATSFKRAGFDIESALTLTKAAMDLTIAANVEANLSTEIIISTLKGFGAGAEDASRLVGILNGVSDKYATTATQLGIGMSKLSPIASQMGFSFEETAGLLTPVIEVFRSGDEAAIAYRTGLLKLVDDAKPVADGLAAIGVSQKDVNGNMRSGRDIYYDVAEAFKTLDENEKLVIASQLVGIRQAAKLVIGFDGLSKTIEVTNTALSSHDSHVAQVELRLKSAEVAVDRFKSGFVNLAAVVGTEFLAASKGVIEGGIAIEEALTQAIDAGALDELFEALEAGLDAFAANLLTVAENIPGALEGLDFEDFLASFGSLGDSIQGTFDQIDLTTPEGLEEFLQFFVDGLTSLINVTSGMVDAFSPFVEALFQTADAFFNLGEETQSAGGYLTGMLAGINQLTGPIGALLSAVGGLSGGFQLLINLKTLQALNAISGGTVSLTSSLTGILTAVKAGTLAFAPYLAAIAAIGYTVYKTAESYNSWQDAEKELDASINRGNEAKEALSGKLEKISDQTGIFIGDSQDLRSEIDAGTIALNKSTGAWERVYTTEEKVTRALNANENALVDWSAAGEGVTTALAEMGVATDDSTASVNENKQAAIDAAAAYYELQGNTKEVARFMAEAEVPIKKTTDVLEETGETAEKVKLKMLDLASEERIKSLELSVSLDIKRLEEDTTIVVKSFSSIDNVINSTASLLGDLFGQLGEAGSFGEKWAIEEQINNENEIRRRAADDLHDLNELTKETMELRNEQLRNNNGEMVFKIEGEGMTLAAEQFMYAVLEPLQIRLSEENSAYLLATGGA